MDPHELELHDLKIHFYNAMGIREETTVQVINSVYQANHWRIGTIGRYEDIAEIEYADKQARKKYSGHMVELILKVSHHETGNNYGSNRRFWVPISTYKRYRSYQPEFAGMQVLHQAFAKEILGHATAFMEAKELANEPPAPQPVYDNLQLAKDIF